MKEDIHYRGWSSEDRLALNAAKEFSELWRIAERVLCRLPEQLNMIAGPISTGGVGSIEGNLKVFLNVIELLHGEEKLNIFSQIPFEAKLDDLRSDWEQTYNRTDYCLPILDEFYANVFRSGRIVRLNFIHGWESSFGTRWEHEMCERLGIERRYLDLEVSRRALML